MSPLLWYIYIYNQTRGKERVREGNTWKWYSVAIYFFYPRKRGHTPKIHVVQTKRRSSFYVRELVTKRTINFEGTTFSRT